MLRQLAPILVGLLAGSILTLTVTMGTVDRGTLAELVQARRTIRHLQQEIQHIQRRRLPVEVPRSEILVSGEIPRWDNTTDNNRFRGMLSRRANSRGEVMLALANDVMMCSNRKTCWWDGGNILQTFLKGLRRLPVSNVVIVTLDDPTHAFCVGFSVGCLRLNLPVPSAQQGSRGANMISTLKYGLLRQALLMGFAILVVDLDLLFLRDPCVKSMRQKLRSHALVSTAMCCPIAHLLTDTVLTLR